MKDLLKKIYIRFFAINRTPLQALVALYRKLGSPSCGFRTMRYGRFRRIAYCLNAESAPGTLESVLATLDSFPRTATVLDYGCGQAKSLPYRALGFSVSACDILPIETANFTLLAPSDETIPFSDGAFNIVIASEVLEHVESPFKLLRELVRVTSDTLIITTPNPQNLYSRSLFKRTGFLHWFTPRDFSYHCSPLFLWQIELFAKRHQLTIASVRGNHEIFELSGAPEKYAESLVVVIKKNKE